MSLSAPASAAAARRRRLRDRFAPWAVLAAGVVASIVATLAWSGIQRDRTETRFDNAVASAEATVRAEMRRYEEALVASRGLLVATRASRPADLGRFVAALDVRERYPSVDGVAVVVPRDTAARPPAARPPHFVAAAVSPRDSWVTTGFDLGSLMPFRAALDQAQRDDRPVLTARFTPFLDSELPAAGQRDGFALVLPVWPSANGPSAARRSDDRPWAFLAARFVGDRVLAGVLADEADDVRFDLFDGPDTASAKRLTTNAPAGVTSTEASGDDLTVEAPVPIYGRRWTLRAQALPGYEAASAKNEPYIIGAGVLGIALALFILLWSLSTGKARVERLVDATTRTLRESEQRFRSLAASSPTGIFNADAAGALLWANERWEEILGRSLDASLGEAWFDAVHREDRPLVTSAWHAMAKTNGELDQQFRLLRDDGMRWVHARVAAVSADQAGLAGFVGSLEDVTERKAFEAELEAQAVTDALTALPNRTLFADRLRVALARTDRNAGQIAVLFVDLDRFKVINDSLGHAVGDELLCAVAERLRHALRLGDTLARFGGDEFVVLCEGLPDDQHAIAVAERIADVLVAPFALAGRELVVTASVGLAVATAAHESPEALIRDADAAMYRAKERGKSRYEVFDDAMRERALAHLRVEHGLRRALERDEFALVFQPKIDLATGRAMGAEALLRWHDPERGTVPPLDFIPIAEETGLIVPIGAWVLDTACREAARWRPAAPGDREPVIAVNLSARQVAHPTIVETVSGTLAQTGLDPSRLCLEVTESVLMDDTELCLATLAQLKDLGVRLAVDDFGTGYSSLAYLRRFPVDILKIDRSFVSCLDADGAEEHAIVGAITSMAHALGLDVVAEGVETAAQADAVRALGCQVVQGYLYSRPVPATELAQFLPGAGIAHPEANTRLHGSAH